jgi:hypothetical protein
VRLEMPEPLDRAAEKHLSQLPAVDEFATLRPGIYTMRTVAPGHVLVEVATYLRDIRREPSSITIDAGTLEEAFLRLTEELAEMRA